MKVLISNKYYYNRGGDCVYTIGLKELLEKKGHEVAVFTQDHHMNIEAPGQEHWVSAVSYKNGGISFKKIMRPLISKEVVVKFNQFIKSFQPDIVHLNNIHTQLSPVIAKISKKQNIPVIWTLHDYKLVCPVYTLYRNETICEDCINGKHHVIVNNCFESKKASILGYLEAIKWNQAQLEEYTSHFIAPSIFMKTMMVKFGYAESKISVLNNFVKVNDDNFGRHVEAFDYYCYIGRLSKEKGVGRLLDVASSKNKTLVIIGTGPEEEDIKSKYGDHPSIRILGHLSREEVISWVNNAKFLVVPSEWYENNPLSIIESHIMGTPVLGANIGGIPEMIEPGVNGEIFESGSKSDLSNKIEEMFINSKKYNKETIRSIARERYDTEKYYNKLINLYNLTLR